MKKSQMALLIGLVLTMSQAAWAASLFAGVTGIEAQMQDQSTQIIRFQSDLPFQYQLQVLSPDRIMLRLHNARLSQNLIESPGRISVMGSGIQEATLSSAKGDYEEIILSGRNLGQKKVQVVGAEQMPPARVKAAVKSQPGSVASIPPVALSAKSHPLPDEAVNMLNLDNLNNPQAKPAAASRIDIVREPAPSIPVERSQGPRIASQTSVATSHYPTPAANAPWYQQQQEQQEQPAGAAVSELPMAIEPPPTSQPAPDPNYQMVMALPRYQGGAAPIQAYTTDASGKPVMLRPKNMPIPEFSIGHPNGGYNALFQAESEAFNAPGQAVSRRMAAALAHYKDNRLDEAYQEIRQALSLESANSDLFAALGEIQFRRSLQEEGDQAYQQAVRLSPGKYEQRYAQVLALAGQRDKAIELLKAYCRTHPGQAKALFQLGTLLEEAGQTEEALTYLKQAAQLQPGSADVHYNLALAYELSGDRSSAETHYRRVMTLNPSSFDAAKGLERVRKP